MTAPFNGRTRLVFEVASIVVALVVGAASASLWAGSAEAELRTTLADHLAETDKHEDATQKRARIDDRVDLHLKPIFVEIRHIHEALERIEKRMAD